MPSILSVQSMVNLFVTLPLPHYSRPTPTVLPD
nr:MAG TPA: hypothetical protein [Caudoviricetes sp.]DAR83957.1 MAG TPA: hypothetical protein [Caudoviricetes sp.]